MKTHYYCGNCDTYFLEEGKLPNINRVHYECGARAKLVEHFWDAEGEKKE